MMDTRWVTMSLKQRSKNAFKLKGPTSRFKSPNIQPLPVALVLSCLRLKTNYIRKEKIKIEVRQKTEKGDIGCVNAENDKSCPAIAARTRPFSSLKTRFLSLLSLPLFSFSREYHPFTESSALGLIWERISMGFVFRLYFYFNPENTSHRNDKSCLQCGSFSYHPCVWWLWLQLGKNIPLFHPQCDSDKGSLLYYPVSVNLLYLNMFYF